ncbi:TPA: helix-turn-helix transcriptional regulator [Pseudomonas aeruginosa]|uniref:helix-turn-helix transcriptional regulator n=1 Tax=Pseudomonas aeruginosa TaxID=287 RepID=UPI00071B8F56|nr:helix-turn-helix transcriptional regulator [Pseudomonas aeruginosa]KSF50400.1 LuxR family transcriptional regulator [Pseudomonas aeruginosa]OUL44469.1 LuxR family transcriptional regulator [Pseudomonas aeruginosa]TEC13111.1 LuxR family transcriptional regulator [Pseudomonas aeruginosa]TQQ96815.1 LuxR family transcriptional regulator [Pseudomonas aeruginosa]WMX08904.1 LuxR C-terminal-related transcriptional regulator [Pseudomonas aeruginosa]
MHTLFRDIGMHASLGRAIEQIGGNRFWKQLILLLRQHLPFDNALAIFYPANGVPVALEEYDAEPHAGPASMLAYLNGLYLLAPFYQACREGLASGLYRLEEIAPDHFRQSEYYLSYFHDNVLEDEVQFILQVPGQGALSLSLGMQRMFADEECGMLGLLSSWVLALMQQHWQQRSQRLLPAAPQEEMATQIRDALSHFGASVLSERELEIARLILRGYSSKAMAERLAISPETIKVHRRHLYAKLDISSQPELFSLFIQSLGHDPENP